MTAVGRARVLYVLALAVPVPLVTVEALGKTVRPDDLAFVALVMTALATRAFRPPDRALFGLVAAAASLWAAATALGGLGPGAFDDLRRVATSVAVLLVLAHVRANVQEDRASDRTWALAAVGLSALGVLGWALAVATGTPNAFAAMNSPNLGPGAVRVAPLMETNGFILYLTASLAPLVRLQQTGRRLPRVAFLPMAAAAVLTLSRGCAGVLVALAVHVRSRLLAAAAVVITVAMLLSGLWGIFPIATVDGAPMINASPNAYRVLHAASFRMIAAHPLAGVGLAQFGRRLPEFTAVEERANAWVPLAAGVDYEPHSTWLGWAAEWGLLGLAGWLVLLVGCARRFALSNPASPARATLAVLAGIAVAGVWVDVLHLKFLWALLGMSWAASVDSRD